jgi:tetratricopeptide (TPR) repeat protein
LGRYDKALGKIQDALNFDKNLTVQAHYNFGEVYSKLQNTKKFIKHYKQAISVNPTASMPNLRLGMLYFKLKNLKIVSFLCVGRSNTVPNMESKRSPIA